MITQKEFYPNTNFVQDFTWHGGEAPTAVKIEKRL